MEILKVVGIGFITLITSSIIKEYKKEFAIYVVLIGSIIIFVISMDTFKSIISFIKDFESRNISGIPFLEIILKTTGIAILVEYAVSICRDSGESAIANKIDFAGKILIIALTIPLISQSLELFLDILP